MAIALRSDGDRSRLGPAHDGDGVSSRRDGVAEGAGFEPATPFGEHAFQACALSRSAIPPQGRKTYPTRPLPATGSGCRPPGARLRRLGDPNPTDGESTGRRPELRHSPPEDGLIQSEMRRNLSRTTSWSRLCRVCLADLSSFAASNFIRLPHDTDTEEAFRPVRQLQLFACRRSPVVVPTSPAVKALIWSAGATSSQYKDGCRRVSRLPEAEGRQAPNLQRIQRRKRRMSGALLPGALRC